MPRALKLSEAKFMPLKLRIVLQESGISQRTFGEQVCQADGTPMSGAMVSLLLGRGVWPQKTPRSWIEQRARELLREKGSEHADEPDLFELDEAHAADVAPVGSLLHRGATKSSALQRVSETLSVPTFEAPEPTMLSPQARRHFKLFRDPFNTDPQGPEDVFRGEDQAFASESIWEAARNSRLFALVSESGGGKTTLMDDFRDRVRREALPVRLIQPMIPEKHKLTGTGILEAIIRDLAPEAKLRQRAEGLSRQAHELLAESAEAGLHNVIIFEEAHDLSIHALKQLKRFHEFKTGWKRLLSIILVGQPELMVKLGEHATGEAREVARRLEIMQLLPLDADVEGYVAHKLARANANATAIFAPDTWDAVRGRLRAIVKDGPKRGESVSMAYPLLVNNLLVKALNTAAEMGAAKVDAGIVKGC